MAPTFAASSSATTTSRRSAGAGLATVVRKLTDDEISPGIPPVLLRRPAAPGGQRRRSVPADGPRAAAALHRGWRRRRSGRTSARVFTADAEGRLRLGPGAVAVPDRPSHAPGGGAVGSPAIRFSSSLELFFYWSDEEFGSRPVVRATHVVITGPGGAGRGRGRQAGLRHPRRQCAAQSHGRRRGRRRLAALPRRAQPQPSCTACRRPGTDDSLPTEPYVRVVHNPARARPASGERPTVPGTADAAGPRP